MSLFSIYFLSHSFFIEVYKSVRLFEKYSSRIPSKYNHHMLELHEGLQNAKINKVLSTIEWQRVNIVFGKYSA